jgi:hypothetical protein
MALRAAAEAGCSVARSFPNHHVQQHASNALFLLAKISVTINRVFSVIPLTVNFPAFAAGGPSPSDRRSRTGPLQATT